MIFVLFFALILLLLFSLFISQKDIFSPSVVSCAMFLISLFFVMINYPKWGLDIGGKTFLVIMFGLLAFIIGEVFVRSLNRNKKRLKRPNNLLSNPKIIVMPRIFTMLIITFLIISIILTFREVYQISLMAGNRGGYSTMLEYYRPVSVQGIYRLSLIVVLMNKISEIVGGWFLFVFIFNSINAKDYKKNLINVLPIVLYLMLSILSGTRSFLIQYISMGLIMGYLLWKKNPNQRKGLNSLYLRKSIMGILIFFLIFGLLGTTTGRIKNIENAVEQVSIYTGLSIVALDLFLEDFEYRYGSGGNLFAFNNYLAKLGFDVKSRIQNQEFIDTGVSRTNVYTAFKAYIEDFSYFGLVLIQFIFGIFYSTFYLKIKYTNSDNVYLRILIYSSIFYALVFQAIGEKFLRNVFTVTTLFNILGYCFLYWIFVKKKTISAKKHLA